MTARSAAPAPLRLSAAEARRLLGAYHLTPRTLDAAFAHLGSVQYDPLKPVGCNPDLVLQARVPGYRIDGWQRAAYRRRRVYDAWDKQVCLTSVDDWPYRRLYHRHFRERWGERVLDRYPDATRRTLAELERRGPLSSLDFGDDLFADHRPRAVRGSWYGDKLVKHVLRGLWLSGQIVTHHRDKGRHVYDLPERVLPADVLGCPDPGESVSVRYLLRLRVRAAGLLRPGANQDVWSLPVAAERRRAALADLVAEGVLRRVDVEGEPFLAVPEALAALEAPAVRGMRFLAPLDSLLWDRLGVRRLFGFDYVWEVYKPASKRRWGYYVLPVWHRGRLVGRFDSRLHGAAGSAVWRVSGFHWERRPEAATLAALSTAARRFVRYLGAAGVEVGDGIDARTREALERGAEA
ncbi:MAG TPA: crosslink repair DNA glycosylase YcaQ family protein [Trueperaceae bacterium]|nr:crosslink repair DNA glycosylase YcaQ family protein [Trueperaceae bacterium]